MKFNPVKAVSVYYLPQKEKILVGRLVLRSHKIFFEYDSEFIKMGLELSPFKLPLKAGTIPSLDFTFNGLFGVFNDSLPDGWGHLLLDRTLIKHNLNPGSLSLLDRLCFVGSQGMGALTYEPEAETPPLVLHTSLDKIAEEISEFQEHDDDRYIEDLLKLGGSSAGARPKVLLNLENEHWLIKFPSTTDPKDIGTIEYAYHLMAQDAGLILPDAKLFPSRTNHGFFGCKRFDRTNTGRVHMLTISGLLHADHRIPCLDYKAILSATQYLTQNISDCKKQYRQCVFNVLSHNRDDHAKNFSFLMDKNGAWSMSPSYDLTFSSGPGGEHCSMIMGEGKTPGLSHLLELAKISNIKKEEALKIIEEVKSAVLKWSQFAKKAEVSAASTKLVQSTINKTVKESF